RSMRELLPNFEKEAPLEAAVSKEAVYFLTEKGKFKFPITPPTLRDHGNYVISLNRFVKWLGGKVEETGITVFTGFAGSELLFDGRSEEHRLNSSHLVISYAVFCLKKKTKQFLVSILPGYIIL